MPPKRKAIQKTTNKATKRPSVVSANIANSAELHAELRNLLSGEQFSQGGYVYVAVDPAVYSNTANESAAGPSQDPLDSQFFEDEQVLVSPDSEAEELDGSEAGMEAPTLIRSQCPLAVQVPPPISENVEPDSESEVRRLDDVRQPEQPLQCIPQPIDLTDSRRTSAVGIVAVKGANGSEKLQPLQSIPQPIDLRDSRRSSAVGIVAENEANGSEELQPLQCIPQPNDLTDSQQTSAVGIVAGKEGNGSDELQQFEQVVPPDSDCKSCKGDIAKKSAEVRKLRKKISEQEHEIVVLKDNVLFLARENQELKDKQRIPSMGFTTETDINMSLTEIAAIDTASSSDSLFVANLAIHFYGTDRLRNMSATGQPSPRFKNQLKDDGTLLYPAREQIEPKIFKFICEKLTERVAQRLGPSKVKEVIYLANEHIVRKHIGQKISNLNKAAARRRE